MSMSFCRMAVGESIAASGSTASRLVAQAHKANLKGVRIYAVKPLKSGSIELVRVA